MSTSYTIEVIDYVSRVKVGNILHIREMGKWLSEKGRKGNIYELQKGIKTNSQWCWKEKTKRWGRMATPSNKVSCDEKTASTKKDRLSRKYDRKK